MSSSKHQAKQRKRLVPISVSRLVPRTKVPFDVLIAGEIYSPHEILKAARDHVVEREQIERQEVLANDFYYEVKDHSALALSDPFYRSCSGSPTSTQSQNADTKKADKNWRVVPRCYQLFEGNLQEWLEMMEEILQRLGIMSCAKEDPTSCRSLTTEVQAEQLERDDIWAVSIMLMYVNPFFLVRQRIEPGITACALLKHLARAARPFRFADLPFALRRRVYEYMVPIGEFYDEMIWRSGSDSTRREFYGHPPVRLATVRRLCAVSHEFREEISEIHYSSNLFMIQFDCGPGLERIASWAKVTGIKNLGHLRNLKVTFAYYKGYWDTFHVTYDLTRGLKATVIESCDYSYELDNKCAEQHLEAIQRRNEEEQSESTGVIEFFTMAPDAVRSMLYGSGYLLEEEDEANERDAYQVAYGSVTVYCPW